VRTNAIAVGGLQCSGKSDVRSINSGTNPTRNSRKILWSRQSASHRFIFPTIPSTTLPETPEERTLNKNMGQHARVTKTRRRHVCPDLVLYSVYSFCLYFRLTDGETPMRDKSALGNESAFSRGWSSMVLPVTRSVVIETYWPLQ